MCSTLRLRSLSLHKLFEPFPLLSVRFPTFSYFFELPKIERKTFPIPRKIPKIRAKRRKIAIIPKVTTKGIHRGESTQSQLQVMTLHNLSVMNTRVRRPPKPTLTKEFLTMTVGAFLMPNHRRLLRRSQSLWEKNLPSIGSAAVLLGKSDESQKTPLERS